MGCRETTLLFLVMPDTRNRGIQVANNSRLLFLGISTYSRMQIYIGGFYKFALSDFGIIFEVPVIGVLYL